MYQVKVRENSNLNFVLKEIQVPFLMSLSQTFQRLTCTTAKLQATGINSTGQGAAVLSEHKYLKSFSRREEGSH